MCAIKREYYYSHPIDYENGKIRFTRNLFLKPIFFNNEETDVLNSISDEVERNFFKNMLEIEKMRRNIALENDTIAEIDIATGELVYHILPDDIDDAGKKEIEEVFKDFIPDARNNSDKFFKRLNELLDDESYFSIIFDVYTPQEDGSVKRYSFPCTVKREMNTEERKDKFNESIIGYLENKQSIKICYNGTI